MAIPTTDEVRAALDKADRETRESTPEHINSRLVPAMELAPQEQIDARGQVIPVRNKRGLVVHLFFWEEVIPKAKPEKARA